MSSINVSLLNAATAKAQLVSLPRSMTVAELHKLAPKDVTFSVAGCTPASATTLGDLYDGCAANGTLEVSFTPSHRMGAVFCGPGCCVSTGDHDVGKNVTVTTPGQLYEDKPGLVATEL